jgi:hypothetical protein
MLIYFICAFIVVLAAYIAQRPGNITWIKGFFIFVAFAVMVLLPGLRSSSVGTDTQSYTMFFGLERLQFSDMLDWNALTEEPGYFFITAIASVISDHYWSLLMTIAVVAVFCHMLSIYKFSLNPAISLFVFITLGYYTFFFNGARQGIACAIYTLSFGALINGKFWKYVFWVLIACLFHRTAIIAIPLYFIFRVRFSLKLLFLMVSIAIVSVLYYDVVLALGILISVKYAIYEKIQGSGGAQLLTLFSVALCLFFLFFRSLVSPDDRVSYDIFFNMFILGSLIFIIVMFSGGYLELTRLALYFQIAAIFLWPIIFRNIGSSFFKVLLSAGFVVGHLVYFYIFLGKMAELVPYQFNIDVLKWL